MIYTLKFWKHMRKSMNYWDLCFGEGISAPVQNCDLRYQKNILKCSNAINYVFVNNNLYYCKLHIMIFDIEIVKISKFFQKGEIL